MGTRAIFTASLLFLLNQASSEEIDVDFLFKYWRVEIAGSLWDHADKTITLFEKPNTGVLCNTKVTELDVSIMKKNKIVVREKIHFNLYSPLRKTINKDYCERGPYSNWFEVEPNILPVEVERIQGLFVLNTLKVRLKNSSSIVFVMPGDEIKNEFNALLFSDLRKITLEKESELREYFNLVFSSKGTYYNTVTLQIPRSLDGQLKINVLGAQ